MDLRFSLTSSQIGDIQRAALAKFSQSEKDMRAARDAYNASLGLRASDQLTLQQLTDILSKVGLADAYTANVVIDVKQPEVDTHRPRNSIAKYTFGSKSGEGRGHEVVFGYDENSRNPRASCNCDAGRYQRQCWAVKSVVEASKVYGNMLPPTITRSGQPAGNRSNFAGSDFGKVN